jgi:hypothetical protein
LAFSGALILGMEVFVNLCWLSLLVPAWLLWRRRSDLAGAESSVRGPLKTRVTPLVFICALGSVFVLLFPVISASDDLHAMRAEMEESSPGKRSVSQATGEKVSFWHSRWQHLPAIVGTTASMRFTSEMLEVFTSSYSVPVAPSIHHASRAPPCFLLA